MRDLVPKKTSGQRRVYKGSARNKFRIYLIFDILLVHPLLWSRPAAKMIETEFNRIPQQFHKMIT